MPIIWSLCGFCCGRLFVSISIASRERMEGSFASAHSGARTCAEEVCEIVDGVQWRLVYQRHVLVSTVILTHYTWSDPGWTVFIKHVDACSYIIAFTFLFSSLHEVL